ncbi:MAG: signal recognition particle-docking protein FtsY [Clostridia bacterium]|nr:signal recognition particle-docking protein FtsY [Clostridia bacterium]
MGFFSKIKEGLKKTKQSVFGQVHELFKNMRKVDEELLEELEELLIMADVGAATSAQIIDRLRDELKERKIEGGEEALEVLKEILCDTMGENTALKLDTTPSVILVIGVNGVGKTTSIGKLAARLKGEGKRVLLCAGDTFRAGAIDQLQVWADRVGVEMIKQGEGADPAAVVFDAANAAKKRNADVLIVDTAGRLHNKKNLMDELAKINRVLSRELPDAARENLLVIDATTGQNAVNQAKEFKNAAAITGLVLTKLDGTAKGGIIFSVKEELDIPVKFVGVGEKIDDLQPFDRKDFVNALFDKEN